MKNGQRCAYWFVKCECGRKSWRSAHLLTVGKTNACKSCCRDNKGHNSRIKGFVRKFKQSAEQRGISFSRKITPTFIETLYSLQDKRCAVSGVPIYFTDKWKDWKGCSCSLDRIDSKRRYSVNNVQLVHKRVNMLKGQLTMEELQKWCRKIYKHHRNSKCG